MTELNESPFTTSRGDPKQVDPSALLSAKAQFFSESPNITQQRLDYRKYVTVFFFGVRGVVAAELCGDITATLWRNSGKTRKSKQKTVDARYLTDTQLYGVEGNISSTSYYMIYYCKV